MKNNTSFSTIFLVFIFGLIVGIMWTPILTLKFKDSRIDNITKAVAIYKCKDHHGVGEIGYTLYSIVCSDNYRPTLLTESNNEIYKIKVDLDNVTYFTYTFMDWKNYKIKN